jgi:hypothetical protein
MDLLSHPFRLEANGAVATVEDGTEEAAAEGIAVLVLTRRGERDLVPGFGMTDPTFDALSVAELNVGLAEYGPDVIVTDVAITYPNDRTERIELAFNLEE